MKLSPVIVFFLFSQFLSAQIQDKVDFLRADILIEPTPVDKQIKGSVSYHFNVLEDVDSVFFDAVSMDFFNVSFDGVKIDFDYNGKRIIIKNEMKEGEDHIVSMDYVVKPEQTVYFLGWDDAVDGNERYSDTSAFFYGISASFSF